MEKLIGALEAGGTKMNVAVYTENGKRVAMETYPTLQPKETITPMRGFFDQFDLSAMGIASFGPVDLHRDSQTYGYITSTPKPGWKDYPLMGALMEGRNIPCRFDNDVNAAVLSEVTLGAAKGCKNAVYVTIGTGIGAGIYVEGNLAHGLVHPEVGHMLLRPLPNDPIPHGVCPYHDGCLEGLASGPAINARCNNKARELRDDDPLFDMEAEYLAQMCHNLVLMLSPERIVLGGGVMARESLLPQIREKTIRMLGDYVRAPFLRNGMEDYIVKPALWPYSGLDGAWLLGLSALRENS